MLVTEPMAVEPGCDIVRRARELAAAGEVTALIDAAALGFADSDSERILAGSRGEILQRRDWRACGWTVPHRET